MRTCRIRSLALPALLAAAVLCAGSPARAQGVLFDFDNAPPYTSLPIDVTAGGITAHLSATGQGFSIQNVSAVPVVPVGFSGNFIYPNSIYGADLMVSFSRTLTDFSIWFAPQELACDDTATMRVTAYMGTTLVGTNTSQAPVPGTYPVGTLSCSFAQGFDNVVVHYDSKPPTCTDYGVIFFADNMTVTPAWPDVGPGLAGTAGVPLLVGKGPLTAGSPGVMTLSHARPLAACELEISIVSAPVAFKGGVLYAFPPDLLMPLVVPASGTLSMAFNWPSGIPHGMSFWFQDLISDPMAVKHVALSNGIRATTP